MKGLKFIMPIILLLGLIILVMGVIVVGAIYLSGLTIYHVVRGSVSNDNYSVASIPISTKKSLRQARRFAKLIRNTAQQHPPGPVRDRLSRSVKPVDEWISNLDRLESALSKLYSQHNIEREIRTTNREIEQLRRQLLIANETEISSLRALINSKKSYCAALEELQLFQNQAELKIQKIATDLGATHAEMLLIVAKGDFNDNRFQRLDENMQETLSSLKDIVSAMDDMGYSSSAAN